MAGLEALIVFGVIILFCIVFECVPKPLDGGTREAVREHNRWMSRQPS